jgi:hypothetical protein
MSFANLVNALDALLPIFVEMADPDEQYRIRIGGHPMHHSYPLTDDLELVSGTVKPRRRCSA